MFCLFYITPVCVSALVSPGVITQSFPSQGSSLGLGLGLGLVSLSLLRELLLHQIVVSCALHKLNNTNKSQSWMWHLCRTWIRLNVAFTVTCVQGSRNMWRCHYFYPLPSHADKAEAPIDLFTPDNAVRTQTQTLACTHRSVWLCGLLAWRFLMGKRQRLMKRQQDIFYNDFISKRKLLIVLVCTFHHSGKKKKTPKCAIFWFYIG